MTFSIIMWLASSWLAIGQQDTASLPVYPIAVCMENHAVAGSVEIDMSMNPCDSSR